MQVGTAVGVRGVFSAAKKFVPSPNRNNGIMLLLQAAHVEFLDGRVAREQAI